MDRILIAGIVFLGATATVLVGSWAGQGAGVLLAAGVAGTVTVLSPFLMREGRVRPAMEAVDGWREVAIEMARSRRHRRSLAVIRLEGAAAGPPFRIEVNELRRRLRVVDHIWRGGDDLFLLLPEADAPTVTALEARLRAELPDVEVRVRAAVFPNDGVTVGSLRRRLSTISTPATDGQGLGERLPWPSNVSSGDQAS